MSKTAALAPWNQDTKLSKDNLDLSVLNQCLKELVNWFTSAALALALKGSLGEDDFKFQFYLPKTHKYNFFSYLFQLFYEFNHLLTKEELTYFNFTTFIIFQQNQINFLSLKINFIIKN